MMEKMLDLHDPYHALQSDDQSPFCICFSSLVGDLAQRPHLSFPFLFLVRLGALSSPSDWNKDYGADLRTLGCIIFKIQTTYYAHKGQT